MSTLQVGYRIAGRDYAPTTYHLRLEGAKHTLCGLPSTMALHQRMKGGCFNWTRATHQVATAIRWISNPHRRCCKRCLKAAPKYEDVITRLGNLA
jgi:hypothetical protein